MHFETAKTRHPESDQQCGPDSMSVSLRRELSDHDERLQVVEVFPAHCCSSQAGADVTVITTSPDKHRTHDASVQHASS
jgi:hypothetical protein